MTNGCLRAARSATILGITAIPAKFRNWASVPAAALLVLAGLWAYRGSLGGPFIFDDVPAITRNPSIRRLADLGQVLAPAGVGGTAVAGRPVVNLSFAINYALGGLNPRGYHVWNLALHLAAGLLLFGIASRTLRRRSEPGAQSLAWVIAALWLVHPLLTESVTCVAQRTESMMGMFYLLTLYGFIRLSEARRAGAARAWCAVSIAAALLGMGTKETMATAPLMVLLYDRTFVAGSFAAAWRSRRRYYLGLFATWLLLGALLVQGGGRRGSAAGFGLGVAWWQYALTQVRAVTLYLKLALWPHPLVVDYGHPLVLGAGEVAGRMAALAGLAGLAGYGLFRPAPPHSRIGTNDRRALGFLGAWFFVILSPSSSVIPLVTQTIAEHRMYLPLVAVVALAVAWTRAWFGPRIVWLAFPAVAGLAILTARRNQDYRSGLGIWTDTVAKCPDNPRAWNNLALELAERPGRRAEAVAAYERALRLDPRYAEAHNNLAIVLDGEGRSAEAIEQYRQALACRPAYPEAMEGLAVALGRAGRTAAAEGAFERALQLRPDYAEAHYNFAVTLARDPAGLAKAIQEYEAAIRIDPGYLDARFNLANALAQVPGRLPDAIAQYEAFLRLKPDDAEAHNNLAVACANAGRIDLAIRHFQRALELKPDFAGARENLVKLQTLGP